MFLKKRFKKAIKYLNYKIKYFFAIKKIYKKKHLSPYEEFLRLHKSPAKERIIGYSKLLMKILEVKKNHSVKNVMKLNLKEKLKNHPIIKINEWRINLILSLRKRRNILVHWLNNIPEIKLNKEANIYEEIIWKYLKHSKYAPEKNIFYHLK